MYLTLKTVPAPLVAPVVLLLLTLVTSDISRFWLSCFIAAKTLNYLAFQSFDFERT